MYHHSRAPSVIHETFDGEVIVVDLDSGTYFSVDEVGSEIWTLVHQDCTEDQVVTELCRRFDATRGEIARDTRAFLEDLRARRLVVPSPEPSGHEHAPTAEPVARRPYRSPSIEPYTDMQDLLLLDPIHEVDEAGWPRARRIDGD